MPFRFLGSVTSRGVEDAECDNQLVGEDGGRRGPAPPSVPSVQRIAPASGGGEKTTTVQSHSGGGAPRQPRLLPHDPSEGLGRQQVQGLAAGPRRFISNGVWNSHFGNVNPKRDSTWKPHTWKGEKIQSQLPQAPFSKQPPRGERQAHLHRLRLLNPTLSVIPVTV